MSETDKYENILQLALEEPEKEFWDHPLLPHTESAAVLMRYQKELAQESNRILQDSVAWQRGTGKSKELSDKEKEILRRSREAHIILQRLRIQHVPAWHWISTIFLGVVPFGVFKVHVFDALQNTWVRLLSAGGALILFVPVILLTIFLGNQRERKKAFATLVVKLYLVEKWEPLNIAKECGISEKHLYKILHRYLGSLFFYKKTKKKKALGARVWGLYLVEKWTSFSSIAIECCISEEHLHKILRLPCNDSLRKTLGFWIEFFDYLTKNDSEIKDSLDIKSLYDQNAHICQFYLYGNNISNLCLIGVINLELNMIAAKLLVVKDGKRIYNLLYKNTEYQKLIQAHFKSPVLWHKPPKYSVGVYKYDVNFNDIAERECLFEWLHINLEKLQEFLANTADQYNQ